MTNAPTPDATDNVLLAEQTASSAFALHPTDEKAGVAMIESICGRNSPGPGERYCSMHSVSGLAQSLYMIALRKAA